MRHVPQAEAEVSSLALWVLAVERAAVVLAVLADGVDEHTVGQPAVAQRAAGERVGGQFGQVRGHELPQRVGPAAVRQPGALAGQPDHCALQIGSPPVVSHGYPGDRGEEQGDHDVAAVLLSRALAHITLQLAEKFNLPWIRLPGGLDGVVHQLQVERLVVADEMLAVHPMPGCFLLASLEIFPAHFFER